MKLFAVSIKPESGFGTPLKGDTLFGHFCWQAAYDRSLLKGGLERWIECYETKPFAVFSSAFARLGGTRAGYAFKKPDLPLTSLFPSAKDKCREMRIAERKENKNKRWMLLDKDLKMDLSAARYISDHELGEMIEKNSAKVEECGIGSRLKDAFLCETSQPHNTINRLTGTTGEGMFAPYSEADLFYHPKAVLTIFVLIDEEATDIDKIRIGMERIGKFGYGRDASIGRGHFSLLESKEEPLPETESPNACYTLGPAVPQKETFSDCFFVPFVRFGKHGDSLARSANPFKNPVIMADEGAVLMPLPQTGNVFLKPYIGSAVLNLSKVMPKTVVQGYSLYLPFRLEV